MLKLTGNGREIITLVKKEKTEGRHEVIVIMAAVISHVCPTLGGPNSNRDVLKRNNIDIPTFFFPNVFVYFSFVQLRFNILTFSGKKSNEQSLWSDIGLSADRFVYLLIWRKKKKILSSAAVFRRTVFWRSGELCHLQPLTTNSCSINHNSRLCLGGGGGQYGTDFLYRIINKQQPIRKKQKTTENKTRSNAANIAQRVQTLTKCAGDRMSRL